MFAKSLRPTRLKNGTLKFKGFPHFKPNLTPYEIFDQGAFGGTYFRTIKSGVSKKTHSTGWAPFVEAKIIPDNRKLYTKQKCDAKMNKFGVTAGTSLKAWESAGWIKSPDVFGWVEWYCWFYMGRRSPDDARQIDRWMKFASAKQGRFRIRLENMTRKKGTSFDDVTVSPRIRQSLHQWAFELK